MTVAVRIGIESDHRKFNAVNTGPRECRQEGRMNYFSSGNPALAAPAGCCRRSELAASSGIATSSRLGKGHSEQIMRRLASPCPPPVRNYGINPSSPS